ncbi:MAG: bifunctional salicylyl-CoA 5-hydroxylase/oxidoreductase [Burkholderiales bacterium]|nr:bifunctional salicylyl-CoA 5-hydroxylase/oxidoreductase [Burkholderiales bacterium]MDE1926138.1 bifunctional salicylyl-CoA 5-hydroxylase/oxidoreductase [Burkholderiales bacterium]MDE2158141.1 bifunctional salicylyl-CoA 5-hydroxylase/oxidoreductase [Burkholderiales bacterium]MDE2502938.1 bifunctional salicylyl-CoA 5-hydroxylase/oxidoreductase [Burkholderiales bacterium]
MKIVCIGGGPAGLYFGLLMKQLDPGHDISVVERNRPYDTFGWGVVFSDATMDNMRLWDAETAALIEEAFNHWDDIELRIKGRVIRSGGHGFVGIGRKRLLNILQRRCEQLGVQLVFEQEVDSDEDYADADLVIASDGIHSKIRTRYAEAFEPDIVTRPNRYIWLGTRKLYDAFTFDFRKTEHGWFQAHIYKFDAETTTFIVECPESVWLAHGLDAADSEQSIAFCERLFADNLQGERLMTNARHLRGSAWLNFQRVVCSRWWLKNRHGSHVVLMGDAVHTAHFAIGSGTKLAIEDAIELVRQIQSHGDRDLTEVLQQYQALRSVETLRLQNAAWNAMEWFEVCGQRYCDTLEPEQFMYSMLTRSQRISHENLRLRDPAWLEGYERWFAARTPLQRDAALPPVPPMFTPYAVRSLTLKNRVVVSPMAQYAAVDGIAGDYHLVHLGARALGGAGLVFVEMTCVSPDARITPGCPGLWNDEQGAAWQRIVDWVHAHSDARIAIQLGHAGAKGSTRRAWDGIDKPLPPAGGEPNWPLISASPQQYLEGESQVSRAMTRADMDRVKADFVAATRRAAAAGFDWLELHGAHGYLLSSFISPLTNHRGDAYGGSLANRLRYPLEVFEAMRAAWPQALPMSVRISAHDWVEGGITPADAVAIARAFKAAGADLIDCSSGQVSKREQITYGRMFQTPFADRVRQEAGIATIAVGAISEADHVNSIIAAGRADLCAIARPHLANPAWTLSEAARIGYTELQWPRTYRAAKGQLEANHARRNAQASAAAR